jgi:hypothetical protein
VWPRVIWSPKWALTYADVCKQVKGQLHISQRSTLVLDGAHITLEDVSVDGTLLLRGIPESEVRTRSSTFASQICEFASQLLCICCRLPDSWVSCMVVCRESSPVSGSRTGDEVSNLWITKTLRIQKSVGSVALNLKSLSSVL